MTYTSACYFTMVAVEGGQSGPGGEIEMETDEDKARWTAAKARRELLREVEKRSQELRSSRQSE